MKRILFSILSFWSIASFAQIIDTVHYLTTQPSSSSLSLGGYLNTFSSTKDGGFVICYPTSPNINILKLDSLGNVDFLTNYPTRKPLSNFSHGLQQITESNNGKYYGIGSGLILYSPPVNNKMVLTVLDSAGQLLTTHTYESHGDSWGTEIEIKGDDIYLFGHTDSSGADVATYKGMKDLWVVKVDSSGNILWEKTFGGSGIEHLYNVAQMDDGFIIAASTNSNDGDISNYTGPTWLLKIDFTGSLIWEKTISNTVLYAQKTKSGNVILLGRHNTSPSGRAWVALMQDDGTFIWQKPFGNPNQGSYRQAAERPNGNLIFSTRTNQRGRSVSTNHGKSDIWIFEIDSLGNLIWEKSIGGSDLDYNAGIGVTKDDGIILMGSTLSTDFDFTRLYSIPKAVLIKLRRSNSIEGLVYCDLNQNGTQDAHENGYNAGWLSTLSVKDTTKVMPAQDGYYRVFIDTGSYTVSFNPASTYWSNPLISSNFAYSQVDNHDTLNIGVIATTAANDLQVYFSPKTPSRPGFDASYRISYRNIGNQIIAPVNLSLTLDPRTNFLSASLPEDSMIGNTLYWTIDSLFPFDSDEVIVDLNLNTPPALNFADTLHFHSEIFPKFNDQNPLDNEDDVRILVTGSYDPNNKLETHGGYLQLSEYNKGEVLKYWINFQNTGSDTAFTVTVFDTILPLFDLSTFQFISASHSCKVNQLQNRVLKFTFHSILLPDSSVNNSGSNGYVSFSIKPNANLNVTDKLKNRVGIVFDFNLPIITKTSITKFLNDIGLKDVYAKPIALFPNPSKKILKFNFPSGFVSDQIIIFDLTGKEVLRFSGITVNEIDIQSLKEGSYVVLFKGRKNNTLVGQFAKLTQ